MIPYTKKILFFLAVIATSLVASARPVSEQRARQLVECHFFAPAVNITPAGWSELYVFTSASGEGFVVVSADDCALPVLAYSYSASFPVDNMPPQVTAWMDGYRHEIAELALDETSPSTEVQALWNAPKKGTGNHAGPLMTTTWNQNPHYNALCPYDDEAHCRTVTGCPATAMAQVMKYWNHPQVGWGSHSYYDNRYGVLEARFDTTHYAWDLMPDYLNDSSDSAAILAVAQLMFHVGVAVETSYGTTGSGAQVLNYDSYLGPTVETALKTYFRCNPLLHAIHKDEFSDSEWDSLMRHQIDLGQPVLYNGGGHAFVIDGYDSTGMFHANWGWGGLYDGYYTLNHLRPGNGSADYSTIASAIIDIRPASLPADSVAYIHVISADTTQGAVSGSGVYTSLQDTVIIAANAHDGYLFDHWSSGYFNTPMVFIAADSHDDTAYFRPIPTDTIGYCLDAYFWTWFYDGQDTNEWGIRVPADIRNNTYDLTAVQYYSRFGNSALTLNIYVGDSLTDATREYSKRLEHGNVGWNTYTLDSSLRVDDTSTLWITLRGVHHLLEANMSRYLGNINGSWCRYPEGWRPNNKGLEGAWMIRGIFGQSTPPNGISPTVDDLSLSAVSYRLDNHTLVIDNPMGLIVNLYDITGRQLLSTKDNSSRYQFRLSGVYLLKVEGECTRKLVVIK